MNVSIFSIMEILYFFKIKLNVRTKRKYKSGNVYDNTHEHLSFQSSQIVLLSSFITFVKSWGMVLFTLLTISVVSRIWITLILT